MKKKIIIRVAVLSLSALFTQLSIPVGIQSQALNAAHKKINSAALPKAEISNSVDLAAKRMGDHYLLLVNTAIAFMMNSDKMSQFEKSPYDGIAVAFWHAYDTSPAFSPEQMKAKIAEWKKSTHKDIWPWVYINRMMGVAPDSTNPYTKDPYFHRIAGADLDGKAGAQKDFLQNWRNSLVAAKDSGAPGVFCDLEFYNFYKEYDLGALAKEIGKTPPQTVELLQQLGARMVGIAANEFPNATIWLAFTALTHPGFKMADNQPYYPSPAYIVMGLLDEIQKQHFPLKVLSGGSGSLAYCHDSLDQLKEAIRDRQAKMASHMEKYRTTLELSGTMTLYSDRPVMQDWVKKDCSASTAAKLEDLQPFVELLLNTYRYNWIYGSGDGGYFAFGPSADRFDALIRKAETHAAQAGSH